MVESKIYKPIGSEDPFFSMIGMGDMTFSATTLDTIFNQNPDEKDFLFNINSDGGSTSEGLLIYDKLRTSGKNIYMNIDGACHSMAVSLLLAAPLENRTANPNVRALIHQVRGPYLDSMTADELRNTAEIIDQEQNAILDIYASRTNQDRVILESLMKEEKVRNANDLLQYGFISKINSYNTNLKTNKMSKTAKEGLIDKATKFLSEIKNLFEDEPTNFDHVDDAGVVLFSTEKEDDSLAVGDTASPDGEFILPTGETVVIAGGVITEIRPVEPPMENAAELEALKAENVALTNRITELTNKMTESVNLVTELKNEIGSSYVAPSRVKAINSKQPIVLTSAERIEAVRAKLNKNKK